MKYLMFLLFRKNNTWNWPWEKKPTSKLWSYCYFQKKMFPKNTVMNWNIYTIYGSKKFIKTTILRIKNNDRQIIKFFADSHCHVSYYNKLIDINKLKKFTMKTNKIVPLSSFKKKNSLKSTFEILKLQKNYVYIHITYTGMQWIIFNSMKLTTWNPLQSCVFFTLKWPLLYIKYISNK